MAKMSAKKVAYVAMLGTMIVLGSMTSVLSDGIPVVWQRHTIEVNGDLAVNPVFPYDMDGDGDQDVILSDHTNNAVYWRENRIDANGERVFNIRHDIGQVTGPYYHWIGDVNEDGGIDVVVVCAYYDVGSPSGVRGTLGWFENTEAGFEWHEIATNLAGYCGTNIGDLDHDGDMDILATDGAHAPGEGNICGDLWWFENDGNENFAAGELIYNAAAFGDACWRINLADFNGDGWIDVQTSYTVLQVFLNNQDGTFAHTNYGHYLTDGSWTVDMDMDPVNGGDGDIDIIGTGHGAQTYWLENDGAGDFDFHGIGWGLAEYSDGAYAGDFDFDGLTDVLVGYHGIAWYKQQEVPAGAFSEQIIEPGSFDIHWVCAADMDNDGDLDMLATSVQWAAIGGFYWWENTAGNFIIIFEDDADDPGNWDAEGDWAAVPDQSFTDSPGGNYGDNWDRSLTLRDPIDLRGVSNAFLSFQVRFDFAEGDSGFVEISTNDGADWDRLDAYSGTLPHYGERVIPLTDYVGNLIKLRFRIVTNGDGITADGWYIDDIRVFASAARAVRAIDAAGVDIPFELGNQTWATMNFSSEALDSIAIVAYVNTMPPNSPIGSRPVHRYYDIATYPQGAAFTVDLTLHYDQAEFDLSGLDDEGLLRLYRYENEAWAIKGGAADPDANTVAKLNVSALDGWWAFADPTDSPLFGPEAFPGFTEVAADAQVDDAGLGDGLAWGDYDGDEDQDLYVTNYAQSNLLYRNDDGTFAEVAAIHGVAGDPAEKSYGAVWGDCDNDGDLDLYVANDKSANLLYRNDGAPDFHFTEVGAAAGVDDADRGVSVAWIDYNRDGMLDLFVANDATATPVDGRNRLYRNDGPPDFGFTDLAPALGLDDPVTGWTGAWGDYDSDGWPDLFVATQNADNRLYHNDAGGGFSEVAIAKGVADNDGNAYGAAWGDYDNDGDLDLYLSVWSDVSHENRLYRNDGNGPFVEVAEELGVDYAGAGFGIAWGDYDFDGDLDLYVLNKGEPNILYRNELRETGLPGFVDVADRYGVADAGAASVSAAWDDYDRDGDMDVCVVNNDVQHPNRLYRNDMHSNNYLIVEVRGTLSNPSGIGTRVRVVAGDLVQIREVSGGAGYLAQESLPLEFGVGKASRVDSVVVYWPSGITQTLTDAPVNQHLIVEERWAVVSLPVMDVAPGDTLWVPVTIRGVAGQDVVAAQMRILFPGNLISLVDVSVEGTMAVTWSVEDTLFEGGGPSPDTLKIAMATASDALMDQGELMRLRLAISSAAAIGDTAFFRFRRVMLNEITAGIEAEPGIFRIEGLRAYGDVTDNGVVTAYDAAQVLRYTVGLSAFTDPDSVAADVSGNGEISPYDASLILQYVVDIIPAFPVETGGLAKTVSAERTVHIGDPARSGAYVVFPVLIDEMRDIVAGRMAFRYDPDVLHPVEVRTSDRTGDYLLANRAEEGQLLVSFASATAPEGGGRVVELIFLPQVPDGSFSSAVMLDRMVLNEGSVSVRILDAGVPTSYALSPNYPNPFNPETVVQYTLPKEGRVRLAIYASSGQLVRTLVDAHTSAGRYRVRWDGTDGRGVAVASGVYFCRMEAGTFSATQKLVMMK